MADVTPRRRGRPPLQAEGSTHVSVRLGNRTYDELYAYAKANDEKIAVIIRRAIAQQIVADRRQSPR